MAKKQLKKLAIVVSAWHFPYTFYEVLSKLELPKGWLVDIFIVAHRDPKFAPMPEFDKTTTRGKLDAKLYKKIATVEDIEGFGFHYKEYPNTVGDWGNTNQWLEDNDYKKYDLFLFTHDDNLLIHYKMLKVVCEEIYADEDDWLIITNSIGTPPGSIRGSFEFFKREMLDLLGGKFDLSEVSLDRTGETDNPKNWTDLFDWNSTVYPLSDFLAKNNLWEKVRILSSIYRVSVFCIEGERGLISNTQPQNTAQEDAGIKWLEEQGII